jgi:hypothetical protein
LIGLEDDAAVQRVHRHAGGGANQGAEVERGGRKGRREGGREGGREMAMAEDKAP